MPEPEKPYPRSLDVLRHHGLFTFAGYWLLRLSTLTPTGLLFLFGKAPRAWGRWTRHDDGRVVPWWQDVAVLIILAITIATATSAYRQGGPLGFQVGLAAWLLVDFISYHARVLWFDDLHPDVPWPSLRVFSHRRVLFQGMLNFGESVLLFPVLYRYAGCPSEGLLRASFGTATTLSSDRLADCAPRLSVLQVVYSLFFLVFVIGIVASVAYRRGENAPHDTGS